VTARELIDRTSITAVWRALGGGPLRHGRGQAFFRDGDGWNISLNGEKNCFYDHAAGEGGGVLRLIEVARGCDRAEALRWLAAELGETLGDGRELTATERWQWRADRRAAKQEARDAWHFARAAVALGEETLEKIPTGAWERQTLTDVVRAAVSTSELARLAEFRAWRRHHPKLTRAMVAAGRASDARAQRELARFLVEGEGAEAAA